jgi:hypothetical protein
LSKKRGRRAGDPADLEELRRRAAARAKTEARMAVGGPLPYELEALGQMMVKAIKKLPPEGQPAGLLAAEAVIMGMRASADAFVKGLPAPTPSAAEVKARSAALETLYQQATKDSALAIFIPGLKLLLQVDETVDPLSGDPPTISLPLAPPLIDNQAEMLMEYIVKQLAQ